MTSPINTTGRPATDFVATGLTAAGTTQATAFGLNPFCEHEFTTVGAGSGVIVPTAPIRYPCDLTVFNAGANALLIYPTLGGTINNGGANTPYSLPANSGTVLWASSPTNWYQKQTPGAGGGGGSGTVSTGGSGQIAVYNAPTVVGGVNQSSLTFGAGQITGLANSATIDTTNASNISSGTLAAAQMPALSGAVTTTAGSTTTTFGAVGAGLMIANTTSGSAAPAGVTLSAAIDAAITSSTGAILTRSASVWEKAPSFGIDITNNCPQWSGIADPATPAAGDRWLSTGTNNFAQCRAAGWTLREDGTFFECGACTALSSFTTSTSLLGSPANSHGSLTIPASVLAVGQIIELYGCGNYGTTASSPTYTFKVLVGGSSVLTSGTTTPAAGGAASGLFWGSIYGPIAYLCITSVGSSGGVLGVGTLCFCNPANTVVGVNNQMSAGAGSGTPVTINTTGSLTIDFQVACSASNASNIIQILTFQARIRG